MRAFDQRFASVYNDVERFPTISDVADEMSVSPKTVRNRAGEMRTMREAGLDVPQLIVRTGTARKTDAAPPPAADVEIEIEEEAPPEFRHRKLIEPRRIAARPTKPRYFILTSAQDLSDVHKGFLANLEAYANWLGDCELMIAGFTYNKSIHDNHVEPRPSSKKTSTIHFHPLIEPYLTHDQIQLGDGLVFCGEMNTLPTAVLPLSGFETYTRDKWGIFPHAKIQLQAVATAKFARTKQLMTTGAVTMPNYVQKKAGIKAGFHHQLGAVLVELLPDGSFFCRHLQSDGLGEDEGGFYDLDRRVEDGDVTIGHRAEALNPGDIHREKLDPEVALTTWGFDVESNKVVTDQCLVDYLLPRHCFFHDLSDFSPRNHHNLKDPHFILKTHRHGVDDVEAALKDCSDFLARTRRKFCQSVVIQSNHDNALLRWLKEIDWRDDPVNALFYLETQTSYVRQLVEGINDPPIFEQVLRGFQDDELDGVKFVSEDDSYMIAGEIECAMHGHLGANGARGNPRQYTKMGSKSNTGHTHSPQIVDGAYVAGVSGSLDMGYNRGLSSWDHSHILTYQNGARTILTMMEGRWYAPRGRTTWKLAPAKA